jgi:hypothetical protein
MMVDGRFVVSGGWDPVTRLLPGVAAALCGLLLGACTFSVPARERSCADDLCTVRIPPPDLAQAEQRPDLATPGSPAMLGLRTVLATDLEVPVGAGAQDLVAATLVGPTEDGSSLSMMGAPFPLVVLLPASAVPRQGYLRYARRLASHGFVALVQSPRSEEDQQQYRDDTRRVIEWMIAPNGEGAARVAGRIDRERIGIWGHSLGGKISLLLSGSGGEPRIKAVLAVDAVDMVGMRNPIYAADVLLRIHLPEGIPLGLLGQTTSRGVSVCMPGADNETFFARARGPAFVITMTGAAHTDFIDEVERCGSLCSLCPGGTAPVERTRELALKYTTAYFLLSLYGIRDMGSYLFGEEFQRDAAQGAVTRKVK